MATLPQMINGIKRSNMFVKSSVDDFQDPLYLTFHVDFFPPYEEYPRLDGFWNSSLFKDPRDAEETTPNRRVEYAAYDWLNDYYPYDYNSAVDQASLSHPARALYQSTSKLKEIQSSPWYFQSILGVGDLWKNSTNVKVGNKKTTLTFKCLESIKQPLTDFAENYRYAVYDQDRLSYRLPDNLRWFDMDITLVEIREIVDRSGNFFVAGKNGQLTSGLKVIKFRCKMCEFDFSDFFGGTSNSEYYAYTQDGKPFGTEFKVNVGWVIQEPVPIYESSDYVSLGIFAGVYDALSNKLSRLVQSIQRLPSAVAGSLINDVQTRAQGALLGNVYGTTNQAIQGLNNLSGTITGRRPPVGPSFGDSVNDKLYPEPLPPDQVGNGDLGSVY